MSAFDNLEGKYKFNFWMVFGRTAYSALWHSAIWNAGAKNWDAARCCDAPYWSGLGGLLGVRCAEKSPRISSVATWTSKWLMGIREWYVLKNLQGKTEYFFFLMVSSHLTTTLYSLELVVYILKRYKKQARGIYSSQVHGEIWVVNTTVCGLIIFCCFFNFVQSSLYRK